MLTFSAVDGQYLVNDRPLSDGIKLRVGASYFLDVPSAHPLAFYSPLRTQEQVSAIVEVREAIAEQQKTVAIDGVEVSGTFYSGLLGVVVHAEAQLSVVCGNHGYMGGEGSVHAEYGALKWGDEFDEGALDQGKWFAETVPPNNAPPPGQSGPGWWNNELQHYTDRPVNAHVDGGLLYITAIKEEFIDPTRGSVRPYTSARLLSRELFGPGSLIEVRARMPQSPGGTWPAIWLLGTDAQDDSVMPFPIYWPESGEIDIMEQYKGATDYIKSAVHFGTTTPYAHSYVVSQEVPLTDIQQNYHTYAVALSSNGEQLRFYVDQRLHWVVSSRDVSYWPFVTRKCYLILNVAVGGNLAPPIHPDFEEEGANASMAVDWVRVYDL